MSGTFPLVTLVNNDMSHDGYFTYDDCRSNVCVGHSSGDYGTKKEAH